MSKTRRIAEPANARWQAFLHGEITVQDMDEEELIRAQFRAADGTFRGRPPKTVPRTFAQQVSRELFRRGDNEVKKAFLNVIREVARIAEFGEKDSDRLRAAAMIWERGAGKVPERVEISAERGFEGLAARMLGAEPQNLKDELADRRKRKEAAG